MKAEEPPPRQLSYPPRVLPWCFCAVSASTCTSRRPVSTNLRERTRRSTRPGLTSAGEDLWIDIDTRGRSATEKVEGPPCGGGHASQESHSPPPTAVVVTCLLSSRVVVVPLAPASFLLPVCLCLQMADRLQLRRPASPPPTFLTLECSDEGGPVGSWTPRQLAEVQSSVGTREGLQAAPD